MKLKISVLLLFACMLIIPQVLSAQETSGIPGAYADVGLGTRPLGMGGAYIAIASDENATRYNPAALGLVSKNYAGFSWAKLFNLVPYNYVSASLPYKGMGAGFFVESAGDDVYRENTIAFGAGSEIGNINLPDFLGKYIPIPDIDGLLLGTTFKIRWASFGNNEDGGEGQVTGDALGFGFDIGAIWRLPVESDITLAFVARDLINNIRWNRDSEGINDKYSEGVPRSIVFGVAYKPTQKTTLAFDITPKIYDETRARFNAGLEYRLMKILALRTGVAQNFGTRWTNRDVMLGLGIDYPIGKMGYLDAGVSYIFDNLVNAPRIGLAFTW